MWILEVVCFVVHVSVVVAGFGSRMSNMAASPQKLNKKVDTSEKELKSRYEGFRESENNAAFAASSKSIDAVYIPPCIGDASDIVYVNTVMSASQTFLKCLNNIADPGMLPTYFNGSYVGPTLVNTSIVLNNLEKIDEVSGTARLQFSIRLYWKDDRFGMPSFWNSVDPASWNNGIDLTDLLLYNNNNFIMWYPLIRFPDATDFNLMSQYVRLNASNIFTLSYALDVTFVQPGFDFTTYPNDAQSLIVRFFVYNFKSDYVQLGFNGGQGIQFNQFIDGENTFQTNQIWSYQDSSCYITTGNSNSYAVYQIDVERYGSGIIVRLVLPITFLLLLSGLTFWVIYENRVDTTITILLSISALYIVILGNIPLVGYLTNVDKFVFAMFMLLVIVVTLHQIYATLKTKNEKWPLRAIGLRLIEFIGRVFVVPFIVCFFAMIVLINQNSNSSVVLMVLFLISAVFVAYQEWRGLVQSKVDAVENLIAKVNNPELNVHDLASVEIVVINYMKFGIMSTSTFKITQELAQRGSLTGFNTGIQMKNLKAVNDLLQDEKDQSANTTSSGSSLSGDKMGHHRAFTTANKTLNPLRPTGTPAAGKQAVAAPAIEKIMSNGDSDDDS